MAAPKKKTTSKKGSAASKANKAAAKPPRRREIGSFIFLFLGLISLFGCFNISAIFLDFFSGLTKGLLGWGSFALPPALFVCAYILAFHRGRPVAARVISTIMIPVVIGCFVHLLLCKMEIQMNSGVLTELWNTGRALESGGMICGLISESLKTLISGVVSGIIYVLGLVFLILEMFDLSISDISEWLKSRERVEYEPHLEEQKPRQRKKALGSAGSVKRAIDIPVDDPPEIITDIPERMGNPIIFKEPNVRTPDKVYDINGREIKNDEPDYLRNFEVPTVDDPIVVSEDAPKISEQAINSVEEPKSRKIKRGEVEAESEAISRTIEEQNQQPVPVYKFPPLRLLRNAKNAVTGGKDEVAKNAERLSLALDSFGIDARITNITRGPSITRYELELEAGVKLNKLTNLADDLALSLGASGVRIAPIPNKISTVGVEVPNKLVSVVSLREVIESDQFKTAKSRLSFALGKDISGSSIVGNVAKLPHLLIAGTTGSGKSVCMNSLILSILYKATPDEVKFIMIDPKMVEFGVYNGIPHLLIPVVTDPKKAAGALQWAVTEMLRRYQKFSQTGLRDISSYNKFAATSNEEGVEVMPQIVVVIDELADLMLVASKEVEESICRVAQMGRASGMHLIIATQRPSADVITGLMKANIPSRIALSVSSSLESRIILDSQGAEKLVGNGDMLYSPIGVNKPKRVQGTFVSDGERESIIDFLKSGSEVSYSEEITQAIEAAAIADKKNGGGSSSDLQEDGERDAMFSEAVQVILDLGQASVSMLQRKLKLGYARAARLMDQMEEAEIVGPFEGSKPRQVLITKEQWYQSGAGGGAGIGGGAGGAIDDDNSAMPPFNMDGAFSREGEDEL